MISTTYTLTTTAQLVVPATHSARYVYLQVIGNAEIYLGGSDVTSTNGTPIIKKQDPASVFIRPNQPLYAVMAAGTEQLRVLAQP
jgi:hypothetical protein